APLFDAARRASRILGLGPHLRRLVSYDESGERPGAKLAGGVDPVGVYEVKKPMYATKMISTTAIRAKRRRRSSRSSLHRQRFSDCSTYQIALRPPFAM